MASFGVDPTIGYQAAQPLEAQLQNAKAMAAVQTSQVLVPGSIQWRNRARMLAGQVRNKAGNLANALENAANGGSTQEVINWLMALSRTINQI
jgi:hypothetical protein